MPIGNAPVSPGIGALPIATKQVLGCWLQNPTLSGGVNFTATLYVVYIDVT